MKARIVTARIGQVRGKTRLSTAGYYFDGNDMYVIKQDDHGNTRMIKEKDLTVKQK